MMSITCRTVRHCCAILKEYHSDGAESAAILCEAALQCSHLSREDIEQAKSSDDCVHMLFAHYKSAESKKRDSEF